MGTGALSLGIKQPAREAELCRGQQNIALHIHSFIPLHGIVLN
jgi:hypothetical protein